MPWAWGSTIEIPREAQTLDPYKPLNPKHLLFSVCWHLRQQSEGSIWCLDLQHVTLHCAGTSVLPGAGTADQLVKQACQSVKIPVNSFLRFLEYYTLSFNSKASRLCKLSALWNKLCPHPSTSYFSSLQFHQVLQKDITMPCHEESECGEADLNMPELLLLFPSSQNRAFT